MNPFLVPNEHGSESEAPLDRVLNAVADARPRPGMEDRILQRLAKEPAHAPGVRWRRWVFIAAPAALAACAVVSLATHHGRNTSQRYPASELAATQPEARTHAASAPVFSSPLQKREQQSRIVSHGSTALRRADTVHSADLPTSFAAPPASTETTARAVSFPAPDMPLTEQERLLLQLVHRNDPVQIAMLDPVTRDLARARDRAQAKEFFAPRPVPPEVQQEIDAAVRMQYERAQTPVPNLSDRNIP